MNWELVLNKVPIIGTFLMNFKGYKKWTDNIYSRRLLMKDSKIHLINRLFNDETIRTVWNAEEEKYYVSVVDVVRALSRSSDGRKYWNKLKQRLKEEGNESVTNCHQLKLKATDGKHYKTDVTDIEGMFRIIESIPSKNAEPIKQWLAHLGSERINETFDPSIAIERAIDLYKSKGYDEGWINKRINALRERKQLTDVWHENGVTDEKEYAILTNEIYKTWSGMTAKEYKQFKGLKKENLRDNMDNIELILTDLSEEVTKRLAIKQRPIGFDDNLIVARTGGEVAKNTRNQVEEIIGELVVTKNNKIDMNQENIDMMNNT